MTLARLPVLPPPFDAAVDPAHELILYTFGTPNGWKASVMLEELGLPYSVVEIDISKGVQRSPWYVDINPNGRIPALHDRRVIAEDGGPLAIFESGAILLHLAEREHRLIPEDPVGRARTLSWLMFQMGGLGPMMGQANVFYRYSQEKIPQAIERYQRESRRLLEVLDTQLGRTRFLAGAEYTIADVACWCWASTHAWSGVSVEGLDHLKRWLDEIDARPAVKRGKAIPRKVDLSGEGDTERFVTEARKLLV